MLDSCKVARKEVVVPHRHRSIDNLHVAFLDEDLTRFQAQSLHLLFRYRFASRKLFYLSIVVMNKGP